MISYRKIVLIFPVVFLFACSLKAQERSRSYIGITAGVSSPLGDFGKAEAGTFNNWNNSAGFAKTGFTAGVEGAYYFLPKWAIAGSFYFSDHGALNKKDLSILGDSYTDAFDVDESTVKSTKRYTALNVMAGPQFSIPVNKLTVDIRVLAGIVKGLSSPEVTVQLEDDADHKFKQVSSTASAFGWQAGAGIRYAFTDLLGLMMRADYFKSSDMKIDNENRVNSAGRLVTEQPMSWLNVNAGICFTLGGK